MTLYDTYMLPLKVAYIIYFLKGVNWPLAKKQATNKLKKVMCTKKFIPYVQCLKILRYKISFISNAGLAIISPIFFFKK